MIVMKFGGTSVGVPAHCRVALRLVAERDRILAWGERLAAALFASGLSALGVPARAVLAGEAGLVTDEHFGAAHPLPESDALLRRSLARRPPLPVVTGFLGRTRDG